jgi:hypothetical protein
MIGSSRVPDLWTSLTISIPRTEVGSDPVLSGSNASLVLRVMACASAHPPFELLPGRLRHRCAGLPTARQCEKAAARRDQAGQAGANNGTGHSYRFSESNLRYAVQTNCSCERNTGEEFAARGCKREEVLPRATEGK